ncbi:MAG: gliding motility protein GldN [Bacteroidia bacterium]
MKTIPLLVALTTLMTISLFAQPGSVLSQPQSTRKVVPYPYIREADVMWGKKVWEVIDLREKTNFSLYYPGTPLPDRISLWDIIKNGVYPPEGTAVVPSLRAYSAEDNTFQTTLNQLELKKLVDRVDTGYIADPNDPNRMIPTPIPNPVSSADVKQYWMQEEWIFDKQRSVLEVRILAIMPVIEKKNEKGEVQGFASTFWISFDELRPLMVKQYAFLRKNSAHQLTFDDVFIKRMFSSYIIKEDNPADRMIAEYKGHNTLDALLEGENIRDGIRSKEADMWHH